MKGSTRTQGRRKVRRRRKRIHTTEILFVILVMTIVSSFTVCNRTNAAMGRQYNVNFLKKIP